MRVAAKGWCPGAYRPMESGDGLIVRVRPVLARLTAAQVLGLCDAALVFGSGIVELTSRANVQLRGVTAAGHQGLVDALWALGLLDDDPGIEARRNVLVAPLWSPGDDTKRVAQGLLARLGALPDLPAKFGFAVDCGNAPVLGGAPADVRVERGASGGLILRADGCALGMPVTVTGAVDAMIGLARWFADNGAAGRMARHPGLASREGTEAPAPAEALPGPGQTALGPACGLAFGQIAAGVLARLVRTSGAVAVRITPARCLVLEGGAAGTMDGVLSDAGDPLLRVDACPGAPCCAAASVNTRGLARALAPLVAGGLHVSGCAKGCARAAAAGVTLVGRDGAFDLVRNGRAWDAPERKGLSEADLVALFGAADARV